MKLDIINKDLVHYRSLETQVRSVEKANSELCNNLHYLQNFAKGNEECSLEIIQKFLNENYEFPEESIAKTEKTDSARKKSLDKKLSVEQPIHTATIGFNFGRPKQTLPHYDTTHWSSELMFGGLRFQVGILKARSKHYNNNPMLQIEFRNIVTKKRPDKSMLKIFAVNHKTGKLHFDKTINKLEQWCTIYCVLWNMLFEEELHWLDCEGHLIIYCASL